jgi:hypothetical protein
MERRCTQMKAATLQARTVTVESLDAIFTQIAMKRATDVIRFRTCCADPRASK